MPISISCSKCQRKYQVRDELAGKVAKCQCGNNISIPQPTPPLQQAVPEAIPVATPAPSTDLFAGLGEEAMSQSSPLQPLAPLGKRRRKKGINPLLILAIAGGSVVVVLLIVVVVISLSGGDSLPVATTAGSTSTSPEAPAANVRWATPEAVFEAMKQAVRQRDWKTFYEGGTPKAQRELVEVMSAPLAMMQLIPKEIGGDAIEPFQAFGAKYGLDEIPKPSGRMGVKNYMKKIKTRINQIEDKSSFFADAMALCTNKTLLKKLAAKTGQPYANQEKELDAKMKAMENAELSELKVNGDTASGIITITSEGKAKRDPIQFVRIDGNWLIEEDKNSLF